VSEDAYWNEFYRHAHAGLDAPSSFAVSVMDRLAPDQLLFELGCGNGRDALFFASAGLRVVACDRSQVAIATLEQRGDLDRFAHRPQFLVADFLELEQRYAGAAPDVVYSRFTLHAVPASVQRAALRWARGALSPGGQLLIEVRSVAGSLYGQGTPVERDAFLHDGHYRRFVRKDELVAELEGLGFAITSCAEQAGVAVFRDDDLVVIRVVAQTPSRRS
jgi:bifunctional enzyme CysN/CysC